MPAASPSCSRQTTPACSQSGSGHGTGTTRPPETAQTRQIGTSAAPRWYARPPRVWSSGETTCTWSCATASRRPAPGAEARIVGRPDIIVRHADGSVTVYDVRSGEPGATDEALVKLYMYLLPRSNHGLWRRARPDGCVLYDDGTERRIAAAEIDDEFRERVTEVMRQIAADQPARHVPSTGECGRCVLTADDCSERLDVESDSSGGDRPGGLLTSC